MAMNVEIPRFRQGHDEFEINNIDMCMAAPAALHLPMNMCQMRCRMAAVTSSIQWTYSAFWRLCPETQALGWYEGYYSGSIKSKCDLHGSEISSEEFGLWRSQQLKELYATIRSSSLAIFQIQPSEDPTALNPEELTELEWFYLNCMSLSFPPGVGLPGRALANRRHMWHCATGELNSRVFLRATIAQKARIQTVVCIPILDGVLEFGTTSLVKEDPALLLQMQAPFLEVSNQPTPGFEFAEIFDLKGGAEHHHELGVRLDDPVTPEDVIINTWKDRPENGNPEVMRSPGSGAFKIWRKRSLEQQQQQFGGNPQWMLKKALMTFPHLSAAKDVIGVKQESEGRRESEDSEWNQKTKARRTSDLGGGHVMAERRRREKLNDRFVTLRTLVPFVTKSDKVSLLGDAIEYVKELQQRVREIQPGRCQAETTKRKGSEYIKKETSNAERKPKVTDANYKFSHQGDQCVELETYKDRDQTSGCLPVEVTMEEDVAVLKICCPGRSSLLIDILQKFVNLQLEVFSVKAAITKGILTTILKAKVKSSQRYDSQKSKEMQAALLHIVEDLRRRSTKSTFAVEQRDVPHLL